MCPNRGNPGSSILQLKELERSLADLCEKDPLKSLLEACPVDADLHLVGGTVRDYASGRAGKCDIDLASAWTPQHMHQVLTRAGIRVVDTGLKHGTVTAVIGGEHLEITTFRDPARGGFSSSIETDLEGRDFTINAMAFNLARSKLIDPMKGLDDLASGELRSVGSAEDRFAEDPLRILRMLRFGPAQGREVEPQTKSAAVALVDKLAQISVERIRVELERILISDHAGTALREMLEIGAMKYVVPELLISVGFEQNKFHMHDVFEHTLWVIDRADKDLIVRLGALFHDVGKPETLTVGENGERHFYKHEIRSHDLCWQAMERLKFSNDTIEAVSKIVRFHMRPLDCGPSATRRLLRDLAEQFDRWFKLKLADAPPLVPDQEYQPLVDRFMQMVEAERNRQDSSVFDPLALDGNDLIAMGMKPGRDLGQVLKDLQEFVIEEPSRNTKEELTNRAKALIGKT